jgi:ubiquinol-cytochrome c reductase cytochrome c1 subunit
MISKRIMPPSPRQSEKDMTMMIRKTVLTAVSALALSAGIASAEGAATHVEDVAFAHEGPFGKFDQNQLQRGLQLYTEVCSACHGLRYVPIRTLSDEGGPHLPEDQVRAYATAFPVNDEDNNRQLYDIDKGEFRTLLPSDNFPVNKSAAAPDLSLMAKGRAGFHGPYGSGINQFVQGIGGPEYIYSILTGYEDPPACAPEDTVGYYNKAFPNGGVPEACKDEHGLSTVPGSWIAMPPPLSDDIVTYADGHEATVHNMAEDSASFLMWAAEPKLMARKEAGFTAVLFLGVLSVLLYLTNKRLWSRVKGKKKHA